MSRTNPRSAAASSSQPLEPIRFPLSGSRLIEASAGTGKTYTIAALYIRLVLGHGGELGFPHALQPCSILVMTFTKAATKELSDRIRARLVEAADYFRNPAHAGKDPFLNGLLADYPDPTARLRAAHQLVMAADAMDDSAVFTIDAWCQRMLREHAFDSGSLFDEELVSDERELRLEALRDYWREQVYALSHDDVRAFRGIFSNFKTFADDVEKLVERGHLLEDCGTKIPLAQLIAEKVQPWYEDLAALKQAWITHAASMRTWLLALIAAHPKALKSNSINPEKIEQWFGALEEWIHDPHMHRPSEKNFNQTAWKNLSTTGLATCFSTAAAGQHAIPEVFDRTDELKEALDRINAITVEVRRHAALFAYRRLMLLKQRKHQAGFHDMLLRLQRVLGSESGASLRDRIRKQYPVALIDEFQDTSPEQYAIFNAVYTIGLPQAHWAFFMIGDPKQAIYSFRGADIKSYLTARRATAGSHFRLDTNFRSTLQLVEAVNHFFDYAERRANSGCGHAKGAFGFRDGADNPLPFDPVQANGRDAQFLVGGTNSVPMTIWVRDDKPTADNAKAYFAELTAERIATMLNDPQCGFKTDESFRRAQPADMAILVRDRHEAAAVRQAMARRDIRSVYLSDNESVFQSQQAMDLVAWLRAIASPLDGALVRAAYATPTACQPLTTLASFVEGDAAFEEQVEFLVTMKQVWQKHGVMPMIRQFILRLQLPALLLAMPNGERMLTDLLHLAEHLQAASYKVDGEQSLIRWLCLQIEREGNDGDDRTQRLESDADLVKVVTVHKSKGLQYPLVFLPYAATARVVTEKKLSFCAYTDEHEQRIFDLTVSPKAVQALERARLEEDLRLLYVALTRAEFAIWMGATPLAKTNVGVSAFGHIVDGTGGSIPPEELPARVRRAVSGHPGIAVETVEEDPALTRYAAPDGVKPCPAPKEYVASFERNWSVSSYSAIARALGNNPVNKAPESPLEDKLQQEEEGDDAVRASDKSAWHNFPRGALPGQFLHDQLEWLAHEGFATVHDREFGAIVAERCALSGWEHRAEATAQWMRVVVDTPLPPVGCSLQHLGKVIPEMEFWVPAEGINARQIDQLCERFLLPSSERPSISSRHLNGMMRGFMDLVFEHDGRYWVLDYKGSWLGANDAAYAYAALRDAVLANRYDIQGALYMLALHRLLKSRLGGAYDPRQQLGGAVFFFIRGVKNVDTHGCIHLPANPALLDALDGLLASNQEEESA